MEFEEILKYVKKNNRNLEQIDYLLEEEITSKKCYEGILKKVKEKDTKRVIDIGCNLGLYGYLFEKENIKYIGIDVNEYNRYETDNIKFIKANYYNVREEFKNDTIISSLCIGYLIPIEDVKAKRLIINGRGGNMMVAREIEMQKEDEEAEDEEEEEM